LFFQQAGCRRAWVLEPAKAWTTLATIIFSSGSTGDPKGVMLSHHNIRSNLDGMTQVFSVTRGDRILGILPFFHSFGFTGTLWLPLVPAWGLSIIPIRWTRVSLAD
jgi:acyl-[acyl-carrier-protein]-phospholipid O-acyltransferase/long-chain-fatty-acid--[acyl-carrier-protein] ligase